MKRSILFFTLFIGLLFSCGKDEESGGFGLEKGVVYDCNTLFDTGDFSSLCFVGNDTMVVDIDYNGGSTCLVALSNTTSDFDYVDIAFFESAVIPSVAGIPSPAEGIYQSERNDAENPNDVNNLGDEAYTTMTERASGDFVEVRLFARYCNLLLTIEAEYVKSEGPHCAANRDELIKIARIIFGEVSKG